MEHWPKMDKPLHKKCPYLELFWSAFFPHLFTRIRTEHGEISPYSVRMRENAGKIRTRITPNNDAFYAVNFISVLKQC